MLLKEENGPGRGGGGGFYVPITCTLHLDILLPVAPFLVEIGPLTPYISGAVGDARAARQVWEVGLDKPSSRTEVGIAAHLYLPMGPGKDEAEVSVPVLWLACLGDGAGGTCEGS